MLWKILILLMLRNALYWMRSCTLCFFLSVVQVSVTRAICLWLKKRWTDSWKVMIFDWGQISEVIFFALSRVCPSFSPVSLCDDAGFTFGIISMPTRLPRNQKSSSSATPTAHAGDASRTICQNNASPNPARKYHRRQPFLFHCKSNIMKIWLVNSRRACQVEFNTVKCPFLFSTHVPVFTPITRRDDYNYQHFLLRI